MYISFESVNRQEGQIKTDTDVQAADYNCD